MKAVEEAAQYIKAYKFRAASQMQFVFDIIFNKRLYCSDWRYLNDPLEGLFTYRYASEHEESDKERLEKIIAEKKRLKICSLSETFESYLLWAHYASGFDGLAIELQLPEEATEMKHVIYSKDTISISPEQGLTDDELAELVLTKKILSGNMSKKSESFSRMTLSIN